YLPHFISPPLPRRDTGDREEYCCAMLTLFLPWRTSIDLKSSERTWEEVFDQHALLLPTPQPFLSSS
ncbi:hypothetical protein DFP72DRAFT_820912, partial [Ephemerocybe angulata]